VLGDRLPTVADVPQLEYTNRVLEETLRLYPVPWLERRAAGADTLGGYQIKANSLIYISPYLTHRHPDFWADPERFDPDRFTPERSADRPRFAYFPFGGGPRLCIGNRLAQLEAQLTLATIAQRYRLRMVPGHPVEAKMQVTTSPRYGLRMTLEPRRPSA
jgi:cytochrome P450